MVPTSIALAGNAQLLYGQSLRGFAQKIFRELPSYRYFQKVSGKCLFYESKFFVRILGETMQETQQCS